MMRKLVFLISTLFLLCSFAAAQTQPTDSDADKEKKKKEQNERVVKMLDRVTEEAGSMRLPQNRAMALAMTADLYWKFDEKRARQLFRNSADEIVAYIQAAEKQFREDLDSQGENHDFDPDGIRAQILPIAATHDGELALDLLLITRPPRLAEAMARMAQAAAKPVSERVKWDEDANNARNEVDLEQRFALLAAEDNPDRAAKMIRDSLANGISSNIFPLLQKINKKDPKKASELAVSVVKRIVDYNFERTPQELWPTVNLLQSAFQSAPPTNSAAKDSKDDNFKFTDSQAKDLFNKVADCVIQPSKLSTLDLIRLLSRLDPMFEKYLPEKSAQLKQREAELQSSLPTEFREMMQNDKIWDGNATPEELLIQISKTNNDGVKMSGYNALAQKIGKLDDEARAKKLIDQIPDEKIRAKAQEQFDAARVSRIVDAGKLDDARKMISSLRKSNQIQKLVALAVEFQKKGGEKDLANAKSLMKDARSLANEQADNIDEIDDLMAVINGYAAVDPETAFRLFEPVIEPMNEYIDANAIISKYEGESGRWPSTFKNGELKICFSRGAVGMPVFKYVRQLQVLGKADLDRMTGLADRFTRPESRLIVKLFVLQGFLKEDKKPDDPKPPNN